jgi:hypothetical protein
MPAWQAQATARLPQQLSLCLGWGPLKSLENFVLGCHHGGSAVERFRLRPRGRRQHLTRRGF